MIRFRTNLDMGKNEKWPNLDHVPQVGSLVYSSRGIETKVKSIEYSVNKEFPHITDVDVWLGVPFPFSEGIKEWQARMKLILTSTPKAI